MNPPGSVAWIARHELRLAWREWRALMTADGRRKLSTVIGLIVLIVVGFHLPAWAMVARFGEDGVKPGKTALISVSLMVAFFASLLLSQAMETVARSFYARADLDLVLSSPVSARRVFSVRIAANAVLIALIGMALALPFIDVLALSGGPRWLAAFGVAGAVGVFSAAIAVPIIVGLFRVLGPRRTRLVAQIVAAVVGTAFAIGIQIIAIVYFGTLAKPSMIISDSVVAQAPAVENPVWLPARALMGDLNALAIVVAGAGSILLLVIAVFSSRFGEHSLAAAANASIGGPKQRERSQFRVPSPNFAMIRKELILLRRDPWLVSQTLTQLLYLFPPALLIWRNLGGGRATLIIAVVALVTVAGQLGGGLAWLAVSGEDAPDLVATAPTTQRTILRNKVSAVIAAVAFVFVPLLLAFAILMPLFAVIAAVASLIAAAASIQIQLWFRAQAKRSHFRRRHSSSRIATFAEILSAFAWAGAAGLLATGDLKLSAGTALFALLILGGTYMISPRKLVT